MAISISTQNYQYFNIFNTLQCCVPLTWKWHLRPFIQWKQGSCTLLEWDKWRTCSLGSRFLGILPEAWCSMWLFVVRQKYHDRFPTKTQAGSKKRRLYSCFSPAALAPTGVSLLHLAVCCKYPATCSLWPGATAINHTPPLPDYYCGSEEQYMHGCLFCFQPISACLNTPLTEWALLFVVYHYNDLMGVFPFLFTHPWNKE